MKEYVVLNGKVEEVVNVSGSFNRTMSFETINGSYYFGINSNKRCDKYGKSKNTGEYYNFNDKFFPWENGIFNPEKLKIRV